MTDNLTDIQKRILNHIQQDFPLTENPYSVIGEKADCSEKEAHDSVSNLTDTGIIRRIGGSFVPAKLGYISSLVAARVDADKIESAADAASSFPEVTHNYEREGDVNLWFTIIADSEDRLLEITNHVSAQDGVKSIHVLPALNTFKIKVDFNFDADNSVETTEQRDNTHNELLTFDSTDRAIIKYACGTIDQSLHPFEKMSATLNISQTELIDRLRTYKDNKALRRFGAVLRHQAAGFQANGMSIWNVQDANVSKIGQQMTTYREVSHCYERPRFDGWRYNMYGMIHCKTKDNVLDVAERISKDINIDDYKVLFSTREFKKTSMVYMKEAN